jgi:hypothetical protein
MRTLASAAALASICFAAVPAHAWQIHDPIHHDCHERISHGALKAVGYITPPPALSGDDARLPDNLELPTDGYDANIYALSLVLGARWDDTQGEPDFSFYRQAQGANRADDQASHCLRSADDDGPEGDARAVAACRSVIESKIARAIASLDGSGEVHPEVRTPVRIATAFQGPIDYPLSEVYYWTGRALHTLEDSFTHTFRSADGARVHHVFNWVDQIRCTIDEARDGHGHETFLDRCVDGSPDMKARIQLALDAATELVTLVSTPGTRAERDARLQTLLDRWLTYEPGCTLANGYCNDPTYAWLQTSGKSDANICDSLFGCDATSRPRDVALALGLLGVVGIAAVLRRRRAALLAIPLLAAWPGDARADSEGHGLHAEARASLSVDEPAYAFGAAALWGVGRAEVGGFAELNPWYSVERGKMTLGSTNFGVLAHYLHPLRSDLRLRFGAGFGLSVLNADMIGTDAGKLGLYANFRLMGLVWQMSPDTALTVDPIDIALPAPQLTGWPILYFQERASVGLQIWF